MARLNPEAAMACDRALRLTGGYLPDFSEWSGYRSIAAVSIKARLDVMSHTPKLAKLD